MEEKINTHIVGEDGLEVHISLDINSIFMEQSNQSLVSQLEQCICPSLKNEG